MLLTWKKRLKMPPWRFPTGFLPKEKSRPGVRYDTVIRATGIIYRKDIIKVVAARALLRFYT